MSRDDATQIDHQDLLNKLRPIAQEHLLAFWEQLDAADQHQLAIQVEQIDPDLFSDLRNEFQQQQSGGLDRSQWSDGDCFGEW